MTKDRFINTVERERPLPRHIAVDIVRYVKEAFTKVVQYG